MFSEDTILNYCDLCKKCGEVRKCPVRARACQRQVTSDFIPASAIENMKIKDMTLFKHIEKSMLTIRNLTEDLNTLNELIFQRTFDT
jgi:hypothetical protein